MVTVGVMDDGLLEETEQFNLRIFDTPIGRIDPNSNTAVAFIIDNDSKKMSGVSDFYSHP